MPEMAKHAQIITTGFERMPLSHNFDFSEYYVGISFSAHIKVKPSPYIFCTTP